MPGKPPVRDFNSYLLGIQLLKQRRLIVEGFDDWDAMGKLIKEMKDSKLISEQVLIDSAELFDAPSGLTLGNREKVEVVCAHLEGSPAASYVVGFVDREYRGFTFDDGIKDTVCGHHLDKQVLWSRGHSIENYLLDFEMFSEVVAYYSRASSRSAALDLLEPVFPTVVRTACALGLAGHAHTGIKIATVRSMIRWEQVVLTPECAIDDGQWLAFVRKQHPSHDWATLHASFKQYLTTLESCDNETARWLCDGHLGIAFMLATFQRAVYQASGNDKSAAAKALMIGRSDYVSGGAIMWSKKACAGHVCWPEELPALLTA